MKGTRTYRRFWALRCKAGPIGLLLTLLLCSPIAAVDSSAQGITGEKSRRGTAGAAHLRIPVTARLASLGTSGTAGMSGLHGIEALFANPAGLMLNQGTGILFSRMEYVVDTGINTFGLAQRIGNNNLALFITAWDFGDIARQTELVPEISELTFSPTIVTGGVAFARQFTDRIAAGATVKLVSEDIDDVTATAVAFDGGMTYVIANAGLRFGFSVKNIGSKLEYRGAGLTRLVRIGEQRPDAIEETLTIEAEPIDLPTLMNVGVAYSRQLSASTTVTMLGNFRSNSFDQDQVALGIEMGFLDVIYVRGGFDMMEDLDLTMFRGGNFGAGIQTNFSGLDVALDYAYRPTNFFSDVQLFTLTVTI